jgi:gas vesicle protein
MENENRGGFLAGFLLGAVIGGAVALLLTQEETRDALIGKAREAGNIAADATGDLRVSAADLYERGRQIVESARSNFDAAVQEGSNSADELRGELERKADA